MLLGDDQLPPAHPLTLAEQGGAVVLAGLSDRGKRHETRFTPDALRADLEDGRLMPSLFTCFATLSFARGLSCVGGYYQAEYLPVMQAGVVGALAAVADHGAADAVAGVDAALCVAGIQAVARELGDGSLIPAGPVEIAGAGGLDRAEVDRLDLPVREACLLALTELGEHLVRPNTSDRAGSGTWPPRTGGDGDSAPGTASDDRPSAAKTAHPGPMRDSTTRRHVAEHRKDTWAQKRKRHVGGEQKDTVGAGDTKRHRGENTKRHPVAEKHKKTRGRQSPLPIG